MASPAALRYARRIPSATNREGARRRRRSDAALNRAHVLDVARRMLVDDPEATIAAVAEAAGLGRGTVYRHFPSRQALVDAVRAQERDDVEANEAEFVRAPGELGRVAPAPLSAVDVLNKVPPHQLGEQIVAEARRLEGVTAAAVYLCDLDGTTLQQMAGAGGFPPRIPVPLAVGPEIPREGIEPLRAKLDELLPGVTVAPMFLRGRAIGVLVAIGAESGALRDLAAEAAVTIELADPYTDAIGEARRVRETTAAAEMQQHLLPPRILRVAGGQIAGNVLPGYDIGGDWFDYAENRDCAWIGIADIDGEGAVASGLAAIILGAFRAARQHVGDPGQVVRAMHELLCAVTEERTKAHVTIARWNGATSMFSWVTCGEHAPLLIGRDGEIEVLGDVLPRLGHRVLPAEPEVQQRRILPGERLMMLSDAVIDRPTTGGGTLGIDGVRDAVSEAPLTSAAGTVRAVEDAVRQAVADPLADDATVIVLVPSPEIPPAEQRI